MNGIEHSSLNCSLLTCRYFSNALLGYLCQPPSRFCRKCQIVNVACLQQTSGLQLFLLILETPVTKASPQPASASCRAQPVPSPDPPVLWHDPPHHGRWARGQDDNFDLWFLGKPTRNQSRLLLWKKKLRVPKWDDRCCDLWVGDPRCRPNPPKQKLVAEAPALRAAWGRHRQIWEKDFPLGL